ncbi:MAG: hypothetical protein RLZZ86_4144 [Cyanobacteriota bacterium]
MILKSYINWLKKASSIGRAPDNTTFLSEISVTVLSLPSSLNVFAEILLPMANLLYLLLSFVTKVNKYGTNLIFSLVYPAGILSNMIWIYL